MVPRVQDSSFFPLFGSDGRDLRMAERDGSDDDSPGVEICEYACDVQIVFACREGQCSLLLRAWEVIQESGRSVPMLLTHHFVDTPFC